MVKCNLYNGNTNTTEAKNTTTTSQLEGNLVIQVMLFQDMPVSYAIYCFNRRKYLMAMNDLMPMDDFLELHAARPQLK